ncbi:MAG: hypothetical protein ACSHXY_01295 [Alphaproteobacteria bacterium]
MPKKRSKKKTAQPRVRTEQKLRAAEAEIKRLRRKNKDCVCGPYTAEEQDRDLRELVDMLNKLPPSAYDKEKFRADGDPFPPEDIVIPEGGLITWP